MPSFRLYHGPTQTLMHQRDLEDFVDALTEAMIQTHPGRYYIVESPDEGPPKITTIMVDDPERLILPFDKKTNRGRRFSIPPPKGQPP